MGTPSRKPKGSAKDAKGKGTGGQFASKPVASQPSVDGMQIMTGEAGFTSPKQSLLSAKTLSDYTVKAAELAENSNGELASLSNSEVAERWGIVGAAKSAALDKYNDMLPILAPTEGTYQFGSYHLERKLAPAKVDEVVARGEFASKGSACGSIDDVIALSRATWTDSSWSASELRSFGINPKDVSEKSTESISVIPDVDYLRAERDEQSSHLSEIYSTDKTAIGNLSDSRKGEMIGNVKELQASLNASYQNLNKEIQSRYGGSGKREMRGERKADGRVGDTICTVQTSVRNSGWNSTEIHNRLAENVTSAKQLADKIASCRPRGGFRANVGPKLEPQPKFVLK